MSTAKNINLRKRKRGARAPPWSPEDSNRFLRLRSEYSKMSWDEFQQAFYPGRTSRALQQRLYMMKSAGKPIRSSSGNGRSSNAAPSRAPSRRAAKVADVFYSDRLDDSIESDSCHDDTDDDESYAHFSGNKPGCAEKERDELVLAENINPGLEVENSLNEESDSPNGENDVHSNPAQLSRTLKSQHSSPAKIRSAAMCPAHFSTDSNKLGIDCTRYNKQARASSSHLPSVRLAQITEDDAVYILRQAKCAEVYKSMLEQLMDKFTLVKPEVGKITDGCSDIIQSRFGLSEGMDTASDTIKKIFREIDGIFEQIQNEKY